MRVFAREVVGVFAHVERAEQHGAGLLEPLDQGRIAFGGRALSADVPAKYLNSNDTELFHKGNVLYNFARARKAQVKAGTVTPR